MTLTLGPLTGIDVVGSAAAFPSDADPARRPLDNAQAWQALFGADWRDELGKRGWNAEHPHAAWGVRRREWWTTPGAGSACDSATETGTEALARLAARGALTDARIDPADIDVVVAATSTPGRITSALASAVGRALGTGAACIDLRAGGVGGLAAWSAAAAHVANGARAALVVAAETPSQYCDPADPSLAMLYGDGAAAVVLGRVAGEAGQVGGRAGNVASVGRPFTVPAPLPPGPTSSYLFQKPDADYLRSISATWDLACRELYAIGGSPPERFVPYAVTKEQVRRACATVEADAPGALANLAEHGCTGCASPLITFHEERRAGRMTPGARVGFCAVGGGIAWQSLVWRVGAER